MITTEDKKKLFEQHLRGESIASIARRLGTNKQTVSYWFRKYFNYKKNQCNSLAPIINEYLRSGHLKPSDKEAIRQWYTETLFALAVEGSETARPAFTEHKLYHNNIRDNAKLLAAAISSRKELEDANDMPTFNQILLCQRSRFK